MEGAWLAGVVGGVGGWCQQWVWERGSEGVIMVVGYRGEMGMRERDGRFMTGK